uniref:Helicase SRCAP n=1 Tax=Phallusia mammillata TaxID=59560 RepID=A0A6F9DSY4_9ASCI|nr:helicase SRCAP [Phallusia mammillata]
MDETSCMSVLEKRTLASESKNAELLECVQHYKDLLTELFFLQHDGNYIEYSNFKKRPSKQLHEHLQQNPIVTTKRKISSEHTTTSLQPIPVEHTQDAQKAVHNEKSQENTETEKEPTQSVIVTPMLPEATKARQVITSAALSPTSVLRLKQSSRQSLSDVYEDTIGSKEEIIERAKQDAVIQRRVAELRKQGLWSQRRLPKVQEPPRNKTHWDYLLEEMRWLAADFAQERKWKRVAARKLVRTVNNYHKDLREKEKKAEKEGQQKLRRIASNIARQVRVFWSNIGKVVQYKQQCLLDEKRQKALDLHLNFIVDQTAKYSDWLTQGLNQTPTSPRSKSSSKQGSDDEFLPQGASSDDEETIAKEEQHDNEENVMDEISLLKQESELPFEDLLQQLPADAVENIGKPLPDVEESSASEVEEIPPVQPKEQLIEKPISEVPLDAVMEETLSSDNEGSSKPPSISLRRSARKRPSETDKDEDTTEVKKPKIEKQEKDDEEFSGGENSSDDETTVQEQEDQEKNEDHKKEIEDLQAEGDMPIEELLKMYAGAYDQDESPTTPETNEADNEPNVEEKASGSESSSENEESGDEKEADVEEIGMDYLLNKDYDKEKKSTDETKQANSPNKEITDVAAEAMTLQPTGHTLATTQVMTTIPHLLRHTLREYQHIGLDWLVTMYTKRLNGILADEMGLGKTIQTIALLSHLACEKGVWGPHLIVVPTSVMLNWEMEFKKWAPGFKILTYYGSQKERKLKRTGWTKSNAFHVCITSYKLVIQDHTSFRRKKWRYLILDEAQNIKNFKSQRWQALLNFNSQRRLLLTGTPLQNNLMELWSLMHFLMPQVFQSHKDFKEWFSNPMTGMIEGAQEFNEKIVRRLHKVLRPFLLRRIKKDVEKQMPNKYEHVVKCHLSKRQRFLYEDFMSKASTKDTLAGGHFMSVINVLMQLRKVCNHPNLFEPRPTVSPFVTHPVELNVPSIVYKALEKGPFEEVDLFNLNLHIPTLSKISSVNADEIKRLQTPRKLIEEIHSSSLPEEGPRQVITDQMKAMIQEKLFLASLQEQKSSIASASSSGHLSQPKVVVSSVQPSSTRLVTVQQPRNENDSTPRSSSQSITLQYQTAQGTRWATIPNGQIRHLPGGVVQIVTSGVASRSSTPVSQVAGTQPSTTNAQIPAEVVTTAAQPVISSKDSGGTRKKRLPEESYSKMLVRLKSAKREDTLQRLCRINTQRCEAYPTYLPANTVEFLQTAIKARTLPKKQSWHTAHMENTHLQNAKKSHEERLQELKDILHRFIFVVPKVTTSSPQLNVSHPTPWRMQAKKQSLECIRSYLSNSLKPYHSITQLSRVQFPEARLIQYDCGKLQILSVLLRRFWAEKHRILIFTQMTRVLDILEAFLSYHGYRYLRLDGSTHIEQRMARMERFNNDPRIFCFILSTRSGGIGVNLTGADTVVFYDSDWNPTMDAQAQDRCHRIGQTRDVHIYRLISERTVEENILKKANQKRLLGNLAIEGGSFTTAFFKHQAIKDLFEEPSGLEELTEPQQRPLTARQKAIEASKIEPETSADADADADVDESEENLEEALLETEDKEDAAAAKLLKQEQDAVMEEFTEAEEKTEDDVDDTESKFKLPKGSKYEEELKTIYEELNPIEKYALNYLEITAEEMNDLELKMAEDQVEKSKQDWQLQHLILLKEEEERRMDVEEDEIFYTREDGENQMFVDEISGEIMPIWMPPTPPQDESDLYVDSCMSLLYIPVPMSEDQLPTVLMKREKKRAKPELSPRRKLSRVDVNIPKSLFNHPLQVTKKKELKQQRIKLPGKAIKPGQIPGTPTKHGLAQGMISALSTSPKENSSEGGVTKPQLDTIANPDWIVNEDWALLQSVQHVLDMPLSLITMMPAHTPNWHLVADMVNAVGSVFRSPKQCKLRFESVIVQREEGKSSISITPEPSTPKKKLKGFKPPTKSKLLKSQKTNILFNSDKNVQFTNLYTSRFDACKTICNKRNPPTKNSTGTGQFQRNPKHTNILHDCGITYDKPLHPMQVAEARAKRIANQKKTTGQPGTSQSNPVTMTAAMQTPTVNMPQQVGSTLVIANGNQLVGKTSLQGAGSNIVVNSAFTRRVNPQGQGTLSIPASAAKIQMSKATSASLTLRTISGTASQLQLQQQGNSVSGPSMSITLASGAHTPMVTITTAVAGSSISSTRSTVTYPPRTGGTQVQKLTSMQQIHQVQKQQVLQTTPAKQQQQSVQQLRVTQQQQQQQPQQQDITGTIVSGGKKVQVAKMARAFTQQELEMIMKRPIKTVQQRPQVQIAPMQAQVQAQRVRTLAAQQASEQITTSKPLPITVPVTNLAAAMSLSDFNAASSSSAKQMIVSGSQGTVTGTQLQQLMKRQQPRQMIAAKQPKTVYATVASHQLVSGGGTAVKMTPQIQAEMFSQIVAQQKRRPQTSKAPVTLTVTKLLQTPTAPASNTTIRHTLIPRSQQLSSSPQLAQLPLSAGTTIVSASSLMPQQRLMSPQIQQIQSTPRSRLHAIASSNQSPSLPQQMIVASTPVAMQRPPVVAISNQPSAAAAAMKVHPQLISQQVAMRNTTQQSLTLQVNPQSGIQTMPTQAQITPSDTTPMVALSSVEGNLQESQDNKSNLPSK